MRGNCVSLSPSVEMLLINGGPNLMVYQKFKHFLGSSFDNIHKEPFVVYRKVYICNTCEFVSLRPM